MTSTALSARTLPLPLIRMYTLFDLPEHGQRAVIGLEGLMITHSWPADGDYPAWEYWRHAVEMAATWAARQRVIIVGSNHTLHPIGGRVSYSVLIWLAEEEQTP